MIQQFECLILSINDDLVSCELHDLTDISSPVEWAEIYKNQFDGTDIELTEGSVFYWRIDRKSSLISRDLPPWVQKIL